jgi:Uncharacterized protein involved in tolerance to divalent cations
MSDAPATLIVQVSCPPEAASAIAGSLVERRLAACVGALPGLQSTYRWQNRIECSAETLLLIKTTAAAYPALEAAIRALHPYELPEILAVPVTAAPPAYLHWIAECID